MLTLIDPVPRPEPFDHSDWLPELKFDGFRAGDRSRGEMEAAVAEHVAGGRPDAAGRIDRAWHPERRLDRHRLRLYTRNRQ